MKALHFGRFYDENFGGLERHVALLLKGLSRLIHVDNLVANERFFSEVVLVAGRARAESEFSLQQMWDGTLSAYRAIADRKYN